MVEVLVAFDDECADVVTSRRYFDMLDKYDALGIGHSDGTSSMFLADKKDLTCLKRGLGDIKILDVYK